MYFILGYLLIGSIISAIFEYIVSNDDEIKKLGDDFKITNSDRIFTILLWPVAILYILFG
jgi:hypothetical protein